MNSSKLILLILTLFSLSANAIVMRHNRAPALYQVNQAEYPSVVNLKYMTGTLIDSQWIVTAAHGTHVLPANYKVEINGQDYYVDAIVPYPQYDPENLNNDIALLKLNKPVKGVTPTGPYILKDETSKHVWFAGSGYTGNGKMGITGPSTSLNHAENIIDSVDIYGLTLILIAPKIMHLNLKGSVDLVIVEVRHL